MNKKAMAAAVSMILAGGAHAAQQERPNVIVIIADDMGYSDISPFGGEIPTPNLQAMAEQGMRMSQYYTSPMSAPARSMLLTGNSNQQAGMGGMWWYDSTIGKEGYELRLTDPGRVYSRENLLNVVWGYEYAGDYRTVDVHVRRLREKLELDPANPEYILTKWGVGYYLKHG